MKILIVLIALVAVVLARPERHYDERFTGLGGQGVFGYFNGDESNVPKTIFGGPNYELGRPNNGGSNGKHHKIYENHKHHQAIY